MKRLVVIAVAMVGASGATTCAGEALNLMDPAYNSDRFNKEMREYDAYLREEVDHHRRDRDAILDQMNEDRRAYQTDILTQQLRRPY